MVLVLWVWQWPEAGPPRAVRVHKVTLPPGLLGDSGGNEAEAAEMVAKKGHLSAQQQQLLQPVKGSGKQQQAPVNTDHWAAVLTEALSNDSRAAADCSPEHKAAVLRNSTTGVAFPPVLDWGCELEQCGGKFVSSLIDAHRRRKTTLLGLTQCDLFRRIVGRTLWIMGDSQMQVQDTCSGIIWGQRVSGGCMLT